MAVIWATVGCDVNIKNSLKFPPNLHRENERFCVVEIQNARAITALAVQTDESLLPADPQAPPAY